KEEPFSVYFHWLEGAGLAKKVLFIKGENNNKLLALLSGPFSLLPLQERAVDGPDAKKTGRYTIDQFGIYLGTKRTVASMKKAQEHGGLYLDYKGVINVPQLGDRPCYTFVRKP